MPGQRQHLTAVIGADSRAFMRVMGKVKATAVRVGAAMAAATAGVGVFSVREAAKFSKGMAEVGTLTGQSTRELTAMGDAVRDVSKELGVNLNDSVRGLYQAISAEIPKENAIDFLRTAGKAAIGGVSDMESAVNGLTNVINAYGADQTDVTEVADAFFETIKRGKTEFSLLAEGFGKVGATAAAAGVSFQEVFAAFATITKQTGNTEQAATSLRATLNTLIAPNEALAAVISKVVGEQGVADRKALGFLETLKLVAAEVGNNEEKLKKLFPNIKALVTIFGVTGKNAATAAAALQGMADSAGNTDRAFVRMSRTVAFQFAQIRVALQDAAVTIGEQLIPQIRKLIPEFRQFVQQGDGVRNIADAFFIMASALASVVKWFAEMRAEMEAFTNSKLAPFFLGIGKDTFRPVDRTERKQLKELGRGINATDVALAKQLKGKTLGGQSALSFVGPGEKSGLDRIAGLGRFGLAGLILSELGIGNGPESMTAQLRKLTEIQGLMLQHTAGIPKADT